MSQLLVRSALLAAASALALSLPAFASSHGSEGHGSDSHGHGSDSHGHDSDSHGHGSDDDDDDASCPCFSEHDLKSEFRRGDLCYDYTATSTHGNGTYLAYYTGQGKDAGVADWYYTNGVPVCADVTLTTGAGAFVAPITADEWDACTDIVLEVAEDLHMTCASAP